MKNYKLTYDEYGFLKEPIQTDEYYIAQQENDSVSISVVFPAILTGSVKAYIEYAGGGDIIECDNLTVNKHISTAVLSSKHLRYHYLLIGFEVDTGTKQIRFEPVRLEVDKFVNPTGSASPSAYTVTVNIGNVTELEPGETPTVKNTGTEKNVVLDFEIPRGYKGDTGEAGYSPVRGVDYYTAEDVEKIVAETKRLVLEEMPVDAGFSFDSENPVQNSVITNALYPVVTADNSNANDSQKRTNVYDYLKNTSLQGLTIKGKSVLYGTDYPKSIRCMYDNIYIRRSTGNSGYKTNISSGPLKVDDASFPMRSIPYGNTHYYPDVIEADVENKKLYYVENIRELKTDCSIAGLQWSSSQSTDEIGFAYMDYAAKNIIDSMFNSDEISMLNNQESILRSSIIVCNYFDNYGATSQRNISVGECALIQGWSPNSSRPTFRLWFSFDMTDNIFGITVEDDDSTKLQKMKEVFSKTPLVIHFAKTASLVAKKEITGKTYPVSNLFEPVDSNVMSVYTYGYIYDIVTNKIVSTSGYDASIEISYKQDTVKSVEDIKKQIKELGGAI